MLTQHRLKGVLVQHIPGSLCSSLLYNNDLTEGSKRVKRRMPLLASHTHVMTVLAQHSVLAQHLEGAVLTQRRLGEGVLVQHISGRACAAPCFRATQLTEGSSQQ